MKNIFTPEDFLVDDVTEATWHYKASQIANEKLNKLIESWPVVYGDIEFKCEWSKLRLNNNTHMARLAFIEEIKPKCEKHEPGLVGATTQNKIVSTCVHCKVELVAEWRVKE